MNTALKHWKEAATVILAAGCSRPALRARPQDGFDYKVLLLKRSARSGFMPNAYVFPGGLAEPSDFSSDWTELFKPVRDVPNFGLPTVKQPAGTRPPMFVTNRADLGSPVPGDVAFRICAVRETFEECGVLLVVPTSRLSGARVRSSPQWDPGALARWRALVIENASNFVKMCREMECVPNIWGLHEWGNWLTPVGQKRRYDTAFYLCCLDEIPDTAQDDKEILHYQWSTPPEILQNYKNREFWIAPPQFYDLGRMCNFSALSDLCTFAKLRSQEGCEQWLPVFLKATNGSVSLLPGDSLYPEDPDSSGKIKSNFPEGTTVEELERNCPNLHRIVLKDLYTASVHINIKPKYSHLSPISSDATDGKTKDSKL